MMRKYTCIGLLLTITLLLLGAIPAAGQDDDRPVITPENAHRLTQVNSLWRGRAFDVAWSPRGDVIAVGTSDGVYLHDADDVHAEPRKLEEFEWGFARFLAFAPDGSLLAAAVLDQVIVWDIASGTQIALLETDAGQVWNLAWSPEGTVLAAACLDYGEVDGNMVQIWDVPTQTLLTSLPGEGEYVRSVAWSPDGITLAAGIGDTVYVWRRAEDDFATWSLRSQTIPVRSVNAPLAFSPDGQWLAVGNSGPVQLIDVRQLTVERELSPFEESIESVHRIAFSPNGQWLAVVGDTGATHIIHIASGVEWTTEQYQATYVAFSLDNSQLVGSSHLFSDVILWDVNTGEELTRIEGYSQRVNDMVFAPQSSNIVISRTDGSIWRWDAATAADPILLYRHHDLFIPPAELALNADQQLIMVSDHNSVFTIDVATGVMHTDYPERDNSVWALATSPDNAFVAIGDSDGVVEVWRTSDRTLLTTSQLEEYNPNLVFSPDSTLLAGNGTDNTLWVWDVTKNALRVNVSIEDRVNGIAFTPDSTQIAVITDGGDILIWDTAALDTTTDTTSAHILELAEGEGYSLYFSPDGSLMAVTDRYRLRLVDATTGTELVQHITGEIVVAAWSPDGTLLITASINDVVQVWSIPTEE